MQGTVLNRSLQTVVFMNLANKLTISRIFLAGFFILFLFIKGPAAKFMAMAIFLAACVTEYYDGYLARKTNGVTSFGKLMDPIADKILILGAFLAFVEMEVIPAWMVMIIIARELIITGIRILALSQKKVLSAEVGGKHKTVSQMVAVISILIFLIIRDLGFTIRYAEYFNIGLQVLMIIVVAMTIASGISYMIKNKDIFMGDK